MQLIHPVRCFLRGQEQRPRERLSQSTGHNEGDMKVDKNIGVKVKILLKHSFKEYNWGFKELLLRNIEIKLQVRY